MLAPLSSLTHFPSIFIQAILPAAEQVLMTAKNATAGLDNASAGSPVRLRAHCKLRYGVGRLCVVSISPGGSMLTHRGMLFTALSPGRKRRLLGHNRPASLDVSDVSCVVRAATFTLILPSR